MMHYKKGKNVEEELTREQIPLANLPPSFLWMHVKGGSRIFGLIDYAKKELESGQYRAMVWSGTGGGVGKTISCAEIMKKDYELHQVTRICYRKVEEFWDPQQEGLEPIVATRNIPSIHILLSLDEIDPKTPGYQHSRTRTTFWCDGDPERKAGRKNYFTGPQLKKKPNRHYENDGAGTGGGGANGSGGPGGAGNGGNKNKKKNKNKGGKPGGEGGQPEVKKDSGGKAENKAKKAKNNENKQKAQNSVSGGAAPVEKEPPAGTSSES
uniref:DNA/RNA-binding protein Alba-like domain-containing protein n=1 Tax=Culex tarsalis TaxID=7177 RepID=A0A1Q3F483_CULTA